MGLAGRQHGVITRAQLLQLGFQPTTISRLIAEGHLHRLHDGIYAVGRPELEHRGRLFAAVAACGPLAALGQRSAGAEWGIYSHPENARIDVLAPRGKHRARRGVALHHTRFLPEHDRVVLGLIPVTTVARTLRDIAAVTSFRKLRDGFEEANRRGLLDLDDLFEVLGRSNGHRGVAPLHRLALAWSAPPARLRSLLEHRFYRLHDRQGLPKPEVNVILHGYEVDFLWRDAMLVVETDGGAHHSSPADRERDARRDLDLQLAGYLVARFSYWQVFDAPDAVVRRVAELLRSRLSPAR